MNSVGTHMIDVVCETYENGPIPPSRHTLSVTFHDRMTPANAESPSHPFALDVSLNVGSFIRDTIARSHP